MIKRVILPAIFAMSFGVAGLAQAQTATSTPSNTNTSASSAGPTVASTNSATNNAVNTASPNNPGAPVPGANSFTANEARKRIQDHGYTQVSDLKLDNQGIWRAKANKGGQSVNVAMDYQGNVVTK